MELLFVTGLHCFWLTFSVRVFICFGFFVRGDSSKGVVDRELSRDLSRNLVNGGEKTNEGILLVIVVIGRSSTLAAAASKISNSCTIHFTGY